MKTFTNADTNPMSWVEMSDLTDTVISKIEAHFSARDERINVIAPLLRTGGILGGILSIKMKVVTMLPVQYKYFYDPASIKQIISIPEILVDIPTKMNILLCEGNTSSGSISKKAAFKLKQKYPQAKIYLATLTKVYGGPDTIDGIENIFYGCLTDEMFVADEETKRKLNLRRGITIFPWENAEDELRDINSS
jgi:hypothetical protein